MCGNGRSSVVRIHLHSVRCLDSGLLTARFVYSFSPSPFTTTAYLLHCAWRCVSRTFTGIFNILLHLKMLDSETEDDKYV
jgi:hypothetical protein